MSNLLAIGTYNLELIPGIPTPVLDEDFPVTVHIKMAALDPAGVEGDDNEEPSTVRILKRTVNVNDYGDENSEDDMDLSDEEVEEVKSVSKKGKKAAAAEESDEEEEEDDDEDFEVEEYVLCTLSPKTGYQQTLDLVISSDEEIVFEVRGSYPVHLTGNYVEHPYDQQNSEDEEEEFDSEDDLEDELDSEIEEEIVEPKKEVKKVAAKKEEPKKEVKVVAAKKEEPKKAAVVAKKEEPKETKKRVAEVEEPKVAAKKTKKEEEVPVKKAAKVVVRKIEGGVSIEDRTVGQGPVAKKGSKVGVRYVGKLKNGKIFDSNTKGKPFTFNLGKGEVIKGWDVGVAGMAVNGERRIVIPAPYAYGKQALPGIPANSELTFDVKLVNIR